MTVSNTDSAKIEWVRTPRQVRSRETLERILDAAEALLTSRGLESVSVAEIAEAAGSSVGALYARFRDKDGLLHILHERFCEDAMATADQALHPERWQDSSAGEIVHALTASLIRLYSHKRGLLQAFMMRGMADPLFRERDRRLGEHFIQRLQELLASREEIAHPGPGFAVTFGMNMVLGVLQGRYIFCAEDEPHALHPGLTEEVLEQELTRAYCTYLGLPYEEQAPAANRRVG